MLLTLQNYFNGSNPAKVIPTEKESENDSAKAICGNDDQKDPKRLGEGTQDNDHLEAKKDIFECVFTSTENNSFEWEQDLLSLKINLEAQIKVLQDQIDSTRNSQ